MATFYVQQKITPFANQYRVYDDQDGQPGKLIAFAHQKRLALKERIIFYTDETKKEEVFNFQARNVLDVAALYDITDASGELLGTLQKQFKQSLLRSTWHVHKAYRGEPLLVVQERNMGIAVLRRLWGFIPIIGDLPFFIKFHFDFFDPVLKQNSATYDKMTVVRDHYRLQAEDALLENIDWRVLVAQGVALDALQHR